MRPSAEMPYHIGLKVKLYPSDKQKHIIAVNDGAKRAVYNHLVACSNEIYSLKKSCEQSYQTNAHYYFDKEGNLTSNVRFEDSRHVTLPKLGRIRFGGSKKLIASLMDRNSDTRIGAICISRDSVGEYWASPDRIRRAVP